MARSPQLEIPVTSPSGGPAVLSHNLPRRPHFVLHWFKVGRVGDDLSVPQNFYLEHGRGIYVLFARQEERTSVQYVGMTYTQNFTRRLGQHLDSLSRLGASFSGERHLCVGGVEPKKYKRLSRKMLAEIEDYLIWAMKPEGNRAQKKPYRGREMLIENAGYDFGLPRFLYVCRLGPSIAVGQGPSLNHMKGKLVSAYG